MSYPVKKLSASTLCSGVLDVLIVGAGLAGLSAARTLTQHGLSVLVLEARDRVGGRTLSQPLDGQIIDLGGQWIGPSQTRIARIAHELGVQTFPQYATGKKVLATGGRIATHRGTIPALPLLGLLDLHRAITTLEKMYRQVPLERPYTASQAAAWDSWTVESWKQRYVRTSSARAVFDGAIQAIFAAEPIEISFLHFLFFLNSGGGLLRLARVEDGAQQTRFVDGAQEIAKRMASELGDRVVLNTPVCAIEHDGAGVTVYSATHFYQARHAIVAVPPSLAGRIDYYPILPAQRDQLVQRMPMGSVIKCVIAYQTPFWRGKHLSGEALSDGETVRLVLDASQPDSSRGALVAFILGSAAHTWSQRSTDERRRAVLDDLVRFFGPSAAMPTAYIDKNWTTDPWSRGCYAGLMPPGALTTCGKALREPVGQIHWAGTETAIESNGYMDGAVESGERAANEIVSTLQ